MQLIATQLDSTSFGQPNKSSGHFSICGLNLLSE